MPSFMGKRIFRGGSKPPAPALPPQANGGPPRPLSGPLPPAKAPARLVEQGNALASSHETSQKILNMHAHGMLNAATPEMRNWHQAQWVAAQQTHSSLGQNIQRNAEEINKATGRTR